MNLAGRRVLVTGSGGWLGRFVVTALDGAGATVAGLDLTERGAGPGGVVADLAAGPPELPGAFDAVVHLAGLAHRVPRDDDESALFHRVNTEGSRHLARALDAVGAPEALVFVSTVAVYGAESGEGIVEDRPREATDPYGESKRAAEDLLTDWGAAAGVKVAVVRPPLVAGPGAPGNLGDMIAAMRRRRYLSVAGGRARRSLVCADDLAAGIVAAAGAEGAFHLTDGRHPSFRELEEALAPALGIGRPPELPGRLGGLLAAAGDLGEALLRRDLPFNSRRLAKMSATLTFDDARARRELGWAPSSVVERAAWVAGPKGS